MDELVVEPELEWPHPTVIRPLCRRDIRFLLYFSNDSSMSTWVVATIGACGRGRGVPARGLRGIRRRARLLAVCGGFDSDSLQVHLHPLRISQESVVVMPANWHVVKHLDSARGARLWSGHFLETLRFRGRDANSCASNRSSASSCESEGDDQRWIGTRACEE